MKRAIVFFLVVSMGLSLCACGQYNTYEKYQEIIDNLENGNYQNAIDLIQNMADSNNSISNTESNTDSGTSSEPTLSPAQIAWQTNAIGTWIPDKRATEDGHTGFSIKDDGTCVVDDKDYTWNIGVASEKSAQLEVFDGQKQVYVLMISVSAEYGYKRATLGICTDKHNFNSTNGAYYRNEDYTVVDITNDNWQDYFEVKEVLFTKKNAFGEINEFWGYTYFRLKDTYSTINPTLSSGGTEYQYVSTCQDITVDLDNMTYVPVGKVRNTADRNNTMEWRLSTDSNSAEYYGVSIGSFFVYDVDKELTDTAWRPTNIQILRTQGTLYIVK